MDPEHSFHAENQMAIYAPSEDQRLQNDILDGQDMTHGYNNEENGVKYRHERENLPLLSSHRPRRRGPDFLNSSHGQTGYGEHTENAEYRVTGYSREGFGNDDNKQYGSVTGMARKIMNDSVDTGDNAEFLGINRYQASKSRPYDSHTSLHFEDDDDTDAAFDNSEVEDEESLFVTKTNQTQKTRQPAKVTSPWVGRPMHSDEFNMQSVAKPHLSPRSTRVHKRPNVNLVPPTVPTSSISNAALLKRGLKRSKNSVMSKKSHGPNDPENILIVNLRENEDKSWPDISLILNERRINEGKSPSFTPNGCHNRYNRNAPILFAAEGKEFIPVSMQRKLKKNPKGPVVWDDENDTLLIMAVKQVESRKWGEVAQLFNSKGVYQITAAEAAMRTKVI